MREALSCVPGWSLFLQHNAKGLLPSTNGVWVFCVLGGSRIPPAQQSPSYGPKTQPSIPQRYP